MKKHTQATPADIFRIWREIWGDALLYDSPTEGENMEIKNAVIKKAYITTEDHGCLTAWLDLDYGGADQGFGGYNLYSPRIKMGSNYAGHFIWRVLEVVGVGKWEDLINQTIRVKAEHEKVHSIGNIIKNVWFTPSEEFAEMEQ